MAAWRYNPRNPMDWIDPKTFHFHFQNLCYAFRRNLCYLCFQVERKDSCDDMDFGIFRNKVWGTYHAESDFLSWFRDQYPSQDERYHVTWYLSWSPCPTCAEEVVDFLEEYSNLTLSIFTARLYHSRKPDYQQGLRRLWDAGVQLDIMSYDDMKYCWDNFVDRKGMRFQSRNLLQDYEFLVTELEEILRTTMNRLREDIFYHQFDNRRRVKKPHYPRKTYLCYQLKLPEGLIIAQDCLQNKKGRHAEMRFIDKIKSLPLESHQRCEVTCYITWSPCPVCAWELVALVKGDARLSLRIVASRLYFHWVSEYKQGLRRLHAEGIPVTVMSHSDFEDCWWKFVDHQDRPFQPWNNLDQNSKTIERRLGRILRPRDDLTNHFRNLKLE